MPFLECRGLPRAERPWTDGASRLRRHVGDSSLSHLSSRAEAELDPLVLAGPEARAGDRADFGMLTRQSPIILGDRTVRLVTALRLTSLGGAALRGLA